MIDREQIVEIAARATGFTVVCGVCAAEDDAHGGAGWGGASFGGRLDLDLAQGIFLPPRAYRANRSSHERRAAVCDRGGLSQEPAMIRTKRIESSSPASALSILRWDDETGEAVKVVYDDEGRTVQRVVVRRFPRELWEDDVVGGADTAHDGEPGRTGGDLHDLLALDHAAARSANFA